MFLVVPTLSENEGRGESGDLSLVSEILDIAHAWGRPSWVIARGRLRQTSVSISSLVSV